MLSWPLRAEAFELKIRSLAAHSAWLGSARPHSNARGFVECCGAQCGHSVWDCVPIYPAACMAWHAERICKRHCLFADISVSLAVNSMGKAVLHVLGNGATSLMPMFCCEYRSAQHHFQSNLQRAICCLPGGIGPSSRHLPTTFSGSVRNLPVMWM